MITALVVLAVGGSGLCFGYVWGSREATNQAIEFIEEME